MQEVPEMNAPILEIRKHKKRQQYKRMTEDKKRDLIFRVMYLNENVRSVCYELGFNFSTGRNLVQKYKKTGEFITLEKQETKPQSSEQQKSTQDKDSEDKTNKCPLGIIFLSDEKIQLVTSKSYSPEEQQSLLKVHEQLMKMKVI
jgi:hypothetical protein